MGQAARWSLHPKVTWLTQSSACGVGPPFPFSHSGAPPLHHHPSRAKLGTVPCCQMLPRGSWSQALPRLATCLQSGQGTQRASCSHQTAAAPFPWAGQLSLHTHSLPASLLSSRQFPHPESPHPRMLLATPEAPALASAAPLFSRGNADRAPCVSDLLSRPQAAHVTQHPGLPLVATVLRVPPPTSRAAPGGGGGGGEPHSLHGGGARDHSGTGLSQRSEIPASLGPAGVGTLFRPAVLKSWRYEKTPSRISPGGTIRGHK